MLDDASAALVVDGLSERWIGSESIEDWEVRVHSVEADIG